MKTSVSNQTGFDVFYGSIKGREKVEKISFLVLVFRQKIVLK